MSTLPLISQFKSAFQWVTGDSEGAKRTWDEFKDAWTLNHLGQTIGNIADGIPLVGHIKGMYITPTLTMTSALNLVKV
jgi:hypothetical protein